ncbi:MAG: ABC transporter ATP-binding protein [Rhodospirillales bacterium]|nr:ABC transporter ATP-binding protein [Rhodospirillales bacterium]
MTACLETRGLTKLFGSVCVTEGVDFRLMPGERRALIGPNGAGKTTMINLLTGRLRPSSGSVFLHGIDVTRLGEARRIKRGIGRTFQITSLFPALSVRENVYLAVAERDGIAARMFRPAFGWKPQLQRVDELLERFHLSDVANETVQLLPYGKQRLLEFAVSLALKPTILLLDEPAAGLPTAEAAIILEVIDRLPKDVTVLLIDHDMDLVFRFAQRITVLVRGRILAEGTPAEIAADGRVRQAYLGEGGHGRHP